MKSVTFAALAALLSSGAQAVPSGHGHRHAGRHAELHHEKRDIVWITEFEIETVTILRTVYADGSTAAGAGETVGVETLTSYESVAPAPATTSSAPAPAPTTTTTQAQAPAPTTTAAQAPAPTTTTSVYVAPSPAPTTTTTTYQAPAPAPAPSTTTTAAAGGGTYPGGSSYPTSAGASYSGDFTYYAPGLGACGVTNSDADHIVAISEQIFDLYTPNGNPNNNPLCGRTVTLIGLDGTSYTATVEDRCTGCKPEDLDMPEPFFNLVTSNGNGRVHDMQWHWD